MEARPGDPAITAALVAEHGLTNDEWARLRAMLGREPTFTELGIVSALWSEHCSYKHSRPVLKTLPTQAPYVLQGPGENAGVIAIGDGLAGSQTIAGVARQPEAQGRLFTIMFLTVGLVEAMYFINLLFMVVFIYVFSSK